jgi:hypothetical protein
MQMLKPALDFILPLLLLTADGFGRDTVVLNG